MATVQGNIQNTTTEAEFLFSVETFDNGVTDAEALDIAERLRDSDYAARILPGGTLAVVVLNVTQLHRAVDLD